MVNEEPKTNASPHETQTLSPYMRKILLIISCIVLSVGNCGGPLIMRLYFIHGGEKIWLSSWLLTAGWPLIIVVLIATLYYRRTTMGDSTVKLFNIKPWLILASAFVGILTGVDNYLYSSGVAKLPVSTSSLLIASELAFTAGFAYFLVKQKFTSYSVNAIVLLTLGSGVLALHSNSDRPNGESNREYIIGFMMILGAAALHGLILPLMELTYQKAKQVIDFPLVMEIQMIICMFATLFCTVGMLINNDFKVLHIFLLYKQKFTSYSVNAIVLLTLGSVVLALHGNSDRPNGESIREYIIGFMMTIGAAALYGFISPLMQLTYQKAKQVIDFPLVMEIQMIICLFATLFCTAGMLINNDFKEIPREARNFDLGETKYYAILVCNGIVWPLFFIGAGGVIFCSSSLLSGILISVLVPVIEVLGVIFYKENFKAEKGVALVLALWGFVSYFYGEIKHSNKAKKNRTAETELQLN